MKRISVLATAVVLVWLGGGIALAQNGYDLFQQALVKERAEGDIEGALELYQRIVREHGGDRSLAARVLVQMARCYETLGRPEARDAYQRVLREYAEQAEPVGVARARLAALDPPRSPADPSTMVVRRLWESPSADYFGGPSPDGRYLTYIDFDTGNLAVHDVVTGQQRPLTQQPRGSSGRAGYSALSPDGQQVAYGWESLETGRGELRLVGLDTGGARVLYENEEVTWVHPNAWTPDGKYILALFVRKDETNQIVLVSVADGSVRVLKSLDWNYPRHVGLSPDGRYIVYDSRLDENSPNRDIFLLATDGSREIPLIEHPADDTGPVWTPDGTKVVFASDRTGSTSAWVLRVADEKAQGPPELVKPDLGRFFPIGFDRKGSYYYELHTGMTDVYLATLNPVTGQLDAAPRRATQRFVGATYGADWSPDGRYLAYVRRGQREALLELGSTVIIQSLDTGTERELNPCHQTGALRGGQPRRRALCDNPRWPNGHRRSPQAPRPRTVSSCCHVHGGTGPMPLSALRYQALNNPTMTRFLAAGYVTMIPTYHSSEDPQALDALWDTLAIVDHLKEMREVDPNSVVVYGCSVGGDLVLEIAGETEVAATTSEEPITIGFTGILNRDTPMRGASFTVANAVPLLEDPRSFYTPAIRRLTQERIRKINGPIFIAQGDQQLDGVVDHHKIVNEILIPELQAAGKELEEIVYPGQGHCFGFRGGIGGEEEAASTFFADMDAFFKRHLPTQPHAVEDSLVAHVPVSNRDRVALTVSSEILAAYVGTYEIGPGQNIVVTLEGNQLMTEAPGFEKAPLFAESETEFFNRVNLAQLEFVRGDDGIVTHVILHAGPRHMTAPRK